MASCTHRPRLEVFAYKRRQADSRHRCINLGRNSECHKKCPQRSFQTSPPAIVSFRRPEDWASIRLCTCYRGEKIFRKVPRYDGEVLSCEGTPNSLDRKVAALDEVRVMRKGGVDRWRFGLTTPLQYLRGDLRFHLDGCSNRNNQNDGILATRIPLSSTYQMIVPIHKAKRCASCARSARSTPKS